MRISTKIVVGHITLIGIMAALLAYQIMSIYEMQSFIRKISVVDFRSGGLALELIRDRDLIEEYTRKSFALNDPGYAAKSGEFRKSFSRAIEELRSTVHSKDEMTQIDRLTQSWKEFSQNLAEYQKNSAKSPSRDMPVGLENQLELLRSQALEVYNATLEEIRHEVGESSQTVDLSKSISMYATGLALLISAIITFFTVRSISRPLRQLTVGTRAIAEGRFLYRLDTSRRDEFAQLAHDFNTMSQRLSELDTLKKDFVSHVSHELKSPLASIHEAIQLLLEQIPGPLTEKQKRLLQLNFQSVQRLSAMITNLLDLSRIEAGTMEYDIKSQDLMDLIRVAIAENEPKAQEKQLVIRTNQPQAPTLIDCDHDRMIQVLENLLGNAIKFSPKAGAIDLCCEATCEIPAGMPAKRRALLEKQGGERPLSLITIADRGPGIPDAHKEMIFEKFHQIAGEKKLTRRGTGLGLAISHTIVEAHGGAIWVEDNPGGGSLFVVLLPSKANAGHPHPVSPPI